ncbi:division/cell wall cluster transcriptional repressor MraZ [Peptococcus simiae]|uniref:division/cell wall cluster transcriptional repressor MraZ n=1 Tax=Peptococcus simiae TaxID=1643805 RepID=UPI0039815895
MFLGEYRHSLDAKGRLIIPSKFREGLGRRCVVTKGLDGCLFVFPIDAWESLSKKLAHLPLTRQDARSFTRFFFSSASEIECDKQGRIPIPQGLQGYAELDKNVVVIGMSERIEIWGTDRWEAYEAGNAGSFEQLAELIEPFDIGL